MKTAHPITIFWLGFLIAISFFEAPLKFQAPSIDLTEGLQLGRLVFYWLNKVELLSFILICSSLLLVDENTRVKQLLIGLGSILLIQTFWLLPELDTRALLRISGKSIPDSYHHILYVLLEVSKVIGLIWMSIQQLRGYKFRILEDSQYID